MMIRSALLLCAMLGATAATAQPLVQTGPLTFAPLVKRVVPAVVNIAVRMDVAGPDTPARVPPDIKGTPFEKSFRDRQHARREQIYAAGVRQAGDALQIGGEPGALVGRERCVGEIQEIRRDAA